MAHNRQTTAQPPDARESIPVRPPLHHSVPLPKSALKPSSLPPVSTVSATGPIQRDDSGYASGPSTDSAGSSPSVSPSATASDDGYDLESGLAHLAEPERHRSGYHPASRSPSPSLIDFDSPLQSESNDKQSRNSTERDRAPSSDTYFLTSNTAQASRPLPTPPEPAPQKQTTLGHRALFTPPHATSFRSSGVVTSPTPPPEPLFPRTRTASYKSSRPPSNTRTGTGSLPTPPADVGDDSPTVRPPHTTAPPTESSRTLFVLQEEPATPVDGSPLLTPPSSPASIVEDEDISQSPSLFSRSGASSDTLPSRGPTTERGTESPSQTPHQDAAMQRLSPVAYPSISIINASPPPALSSPTPSFAALAHERPAPPARPPSALGLWKHLQTPIPFRDIKRSGPSRPSIPSEVPPELRIIFGLNCTTARGPNNAKRRDSQPSHGAGSLEGVWQLVDLMKSSSSTPIEAFKQFPEGRRFSVMPTRPDTPCPLQMRFEGTGAILNELANTLCSSLGVLGLLDNLNQVLGTKYQLSDKLSTLLSSYVNTETCDFGRAYGELRRGWFCDVDRLRERLRKSVAQDESMRMQAIDRAAGLIVKPRTPPRRVWDLYSNRVLPFWVLLTTDIPRNLWAVSHSWVDGKELEFIRTRINGSGWTVPIPRGVDLDHVRIELLNLGAEYVWLDVLCLRQQVQTSHRDLLGWSEDAWRDFEEKRQEEWKLDVPTIGHVFRCKPSQVVITYFSGLGRPFRVSQEMLTENRSWLNRVWTVQETTSNWLLGGLTTDNFVAHKEGMDLPSVFHARLCNLSLILSHESPDLFALAKALRRRKGTYPADYVSALGLLLDCPALPIYETDMRCEDAWSQLLQQMTRKHRTDLLVVCPLAGNAPGSKWRPSWSQMLQGKLIPEEMTSISYSEGELLAHKIHDDEVVYWNYPYVIENCKFTISDIGTSMHVLLGSPTQLRANNCKTAPFLVDFNLPELNMVMPFEQDTFYAAVGMADLEYWVLGRISDRHEEMEYLKFEKIYTFRMPDAKERERLWHLNPGYSDTPIHYL